MRRVSSSYWCPRTFWLFSTSNMGQVSGRAVLRASGNWAQWLASREQGLVRFHRKERLTSFDGNRGFHRIGDEAGFVRQMMDMRQGFGIGIDRHFGPQD